MNAGAATPSVETNATAGEDGAQGRATLATDTNGAIWIIDTHEPKGGPSNEIRVLKGAVVDSTPGPEVTPATPSASPVPARLPGDPAA